MSSIQVTLPDGSVQQVPAGTSALDIALLGRQLMASPTLRPIAGSQTRPAPWDGHLMWNTNYFVYGVPGAIGRSGRRGYR